MTDRKKYYYLITGAFAGAILVSILRTAYYLMRDYHPNMSPLMFIAFSPIVGLLLSAVAFMVEFVINRAIKLSYSGRIEALLIGISYATIMTLLIEKWLVVLVVLFNPLTAHLLFYYKMKTRTS